MIRTLYYRQQGHTFLVTSVNLLACNIFPVWPMAFHQVLIKHRKEVSDQTWEAFLDVVDFKSRLQIHGALTDQFRSQLP